MTTSAPLSPIWPSAAERRDGKVYLHGFGVDELLESFGSPLYVIDMDDLLNRATTFVSAVEKAFATSTTLVSFAGKAFMSKEVVRRLVAQGLHVDTCTMGEMRIALAAGAEGRNLVLHGNNKTDEEIELAVAQGFNKIVVDSADEPARIAAIAHKLGKRARVMVRVTTGIHAGGHEYISTAHEDQKFGIPLLPPAVTTDPDAAGETALSLDTIADGPALAVLKDIAARTEDLELVGIHTHIGSQIHSAHAFIESAQRVLALREAFWATDGFCLPEVDLGGGYSVAYTDDDESMDITVAMTDLAAAMRAESQRSGLPMPVVSFEPGRWVVAPAGMSIYKVGTVKPVALSDGSTRTYVSVDGGMSDNIRPALYDAEYTAIVANREAAASPTMRARVVGMHCESGDILVHNVDLPSDIKRGDILAIPVTGAYGRTMASNYNQALRPAVVAVSSDTDASTSDIPHLNSAEGEAHVMMRRDTITDLLNLDVS